MFVLPLAYYNHISLRCSCLLSCQSALPTSQPSAQSLTPQTNVHYLIFAISCQKMHFCLSLHLNQPGINACSFSLRPNIRILIIPRRVLPLVIICTLNISTFCSKFDWESVCLASSLVFKISQKAALFLYLHSLYGRHGGLLCFWLFIST